MRAGVPGDGRITKTPYVLAGKLVRGSQGASTDPNEQESVTLLPIADPGIAARQPDNPTWGGIAHPA
jgi:hypothetical protein